MPGCFSKVFLCMSILYALSRPVCYLFLSNVNTNMLFFIQCQDSSVICFLKECQDLRVFCLFKMPRPVCYLFLDTMLRPVLLFFPAMSRPVMNISLDISLILPSETHQIRLNTHGFGKVGLI